MSNKLRYVRIELSPKKGLQGSTEEGLFKKLGKKFDQTLLWIRKDHKVTKAFNLSFFNIVTIETYDGEIRRFTFFQPSFSEQKIAREHIERLESGEIPEWPPRFTGLVRGDHTEKDFFEEIWKKERVFVERTHKCSDGEEIHYYVTKDYDYYGDTGEEMPDEHRADYACMTPHVKFDRKSKKWALHFSGADFAGHDVDYFVYYFDDLNDVLEFMGFPIRCCCAK